MAIIDDTVGGKFMITSDNMCVNSTEKEPWRRRQNFADVTRNA